jgi:hypothetical protein
MQLDQQRSDQQMEEQQRQAQINQTTEFLREKGYTDLLAAVEGGMDMGAAWTEALRRGQPQAPKPPIEVGGVLVDPVTFQPIFDSRQPEKPPAAPSGYQWNPDGTQSYVPGGPADPAFANSTKPPTESRIRNEMLYKVMEPEAASLLGDPVTGAGGTFDALTDLGNQGWNGIGAGSVMASPQYQQAQASLKTIIASYLYATSGATANPGEVENQAAILTPRPGESAASIADKKARLAVMVNAVRDAAAGGGQPQAPGGQTSTGLQWSIEP